MRGRSVDVHVGARVPVGVRDYVYVSVDVPVGAHVPVGERAICRCSCTCSCSCSCT